MKVKDLSTKVIKGNNVSDYEEARAKNLRNGLWACHCGSRKFHLLQQKENVKAICAKCSDTEIIYWNGTHDSSKGHMRRLDTNTWVKA